MNIDMLPLPSQLKVQRKTLVNDLVAGMINGVVAIPNGLGGSILAGVNPVHGLYSLIIGTPVAAVFTASALMNVDATSATALATRDALAGVPRDQVVPALVMLVILVGVFQIAFGLLRLGFLVRFISNAVMTGFLTGIATLTVLGQIADLTGYSSLFSNRVLRLVDTLLQFDQVDLPTLAIGMGTILVIVLLNRTSLNRYSFPIALALATAAVPLFRLETVALVGGGAEIPRTLPSLQMPALSLIPSLLVPALAIAITALVQASGVSQSYPNPDGRYPDASRDFLGQGIGNFATGLFAGLPTGGSLSGTAMVVMLGGRSRWANIFTGVFVALYLLILAPLIARLPNAALAGMLIMVGLGMFNLKRIQVASKTGKATLAIMALTFAGTLVMPIQYAVFLGVALHVMVHVYRSAERTRLIRIMPQDDGGLVEAEVPRQLESEMITILQPVGSLFFAGAAEVENLLPAAGAARRAVVILRLRVYDEIGSTFLAVIERYAQALSTNGGRLMLSGIGPRVLDQLEKTGIASKLGRDNIFPAQPRFGEALYTALNVARSWQSALGERDKEESRDAQ
jgi:SulP family sulfate permease